MKYIGFSLVAAGVSSAFAFVAAADEATQSTPSDLETIIVVGKSVSYANNLASAYYAKTAIQHDQCFGGNRQYSRCTDQ